MFNRYISDIHSLRAVPLQYKHLTNFVRLYSPISSRELLVITLKR